MPLRHRLIALVGALMLAATACGGGVASETNATASVSAIATAVDSTEAEAPPGPDLAVLDQGSLEGKDVVVWFWAEW